MHVLCINKASKYFGHVFKVVGETNLYWEGKDLKRTWATVALKKTSVMKFYPDGINRDLVGCELVPADDAPAALKEWFCHCKSPILLASVFNDKLKVKSDHAPIYLGGYELTKYWNICGVPKSIICGRIRPIAIGDEVMVTTVQPRKGWGQVTNKSVGRVVQVLQHNALTIDFPEQYGWVGYVDEVFLVGRGKVMPTRPVMKVGSKVRIKKGSKFYVDGDFLNPKDTTGSVTSMAKGRVKVDFGAISNVYSEDDLELIQ